MEIWKVIEGYEGLYLVSNMGRVKSLDYNHTGKDKILRQYKQRNGYLYVGLCKNSKYKCFRVHRLVACAFIPNPDNKPQIDHINSIKDDNRVDNLRWCTAKENTNNAITISKRSGANNHKARGILQFNKEGVFVREWDCISDAARELGIVSQHISSCCLGKRKTCGGFVWKYA